MYELGATTIQSLLCSLLFTAMLCNYKQGVASDDINLNLNGF